ARPARPRDVVGLAECPGGRRALSQAGVPSTGRGAVQRRAAGRAHHHRVGAAARREAVSAASPAPAPIGGGAVAAGGARGFVASRLLPRLIERGARVIAIVRPGRDAAALERAGCVVRRADLAGPDGLAPAFEGVELAVHLAGIALATRLAPALDAARVGRA